MNLNFHEYHDSVLGCWMGKNIGGTLGAPFEWRRQVNHVNFYTQDLTGEPLPNDDLDIQLLWLIALEEQGVELDAHTLSEYWVLYVTPHWSEYGTAKINLRSGIMPPLSGVLYNEYKDSCGSFIRSEIWACIAPGNPRIAAKYAIQDAIIDHGDGEGVYAEVFCAALESSAFIIKDIHQLIRIGLSYIPENSGVAGAVREASACYQEGKTWLEARDRILEKFRGDTFFGIREHTSEEDWQKGFGEGRRGWDAPSNIGMVVIGLLYGRGNFGESLCTAVNCGEDTDCTAATLGSIYGILHGVQAIPEKWIQPIGRTIKTACLNLGELGNFGNQLPQDVDDLTRRCEDITRQVISHYKLNITLNENVPTEITGFTLKELYADTSFLESYQNMGGPSFYFDFFYIYVDYGGNPLVRNSEKKVIRLRIYNRYKVQAILHLRWYVPDNWHIAPSLEGTLFTTPWQKNCEVEFQVEIEYPHQGTNRAVIEISIDSRPTVMLIPIVFQNGNLQSSNLEE